MRGEYSQRPILIQRLLRSARGLSPKDPFTILNRGLIELKRGEFARAIAQYDAALAIDGRRARAYYGRGMAKLKMGDKSGGDADIAMAKAMLPNVAEEFANYGVR